jgi:molecular chaperone DnaJ
VDPYATLGVSRDASPEEIKQAFRRLAREHHPDRNPNDPRAQQRFQEINAAYQLLSDPVKRRRFDSFGSERPGPNVSGGVYDFSDLFSEFFNQFMRRPAASRDLQRVLELSFEEAALGCTKSFEYQRLDVCEACQGTGQCSHCRGVGLSARTRRLEVTIPPGMESGASQTIPQAGNLSPGARTAGDLELVIKIRPHPEFTREGDDVLSEVNVPFTVAALGGQCTVATLHGPVSLEIPAGTQPGSVLHMKEQGVPHRFRRGRGEHRFHVRITVPRTLTGRARTLLEQFEEALSKEAESSMIDRVKGWFS